MQIHYYTNVILFILFVTGQWLSIPDSKAQYPVSYPETVKSKAQKDELSRTYLSPQRIIWKSNDTLVQNSEILLNKGIGQAYFGKQTICKLINSHDRATGIILDFGIEIHGGIQITTSQTNRVTRTVRLRFGESVSETCSNTNHSGGDTLNGNATRAVSVLRDIP